jgi:hypothetical protein
LGLSIRCHNYFSCFKQENLFAVSRFAPQISWGQSPTYSDYLETLYQGKGADSIAFRNRKQVIAAGSQEYAGPPLIIGGQVMRIVPILSAAVSDPHFGSSQRLALFQDLNLVIFT